MVAAAVFCALALSACGGSKDSPTTPSTTGSSSPSLSETRKDSVADAVNDAILEAILLLAESLSAIPTRPAPDGSRRLVVVEFPPVHSEKACSGGGLSTGDYTMRMTEHTDGSLELVMDMRIGFADCASPGVTLHSDPYLTLAMVMSGPAEAPNRMTIQIKDGVAFTVDGVRGRVRFNCTQSLDMLAAKVPDISGTMSWEYPIGTSITGPGCAD
jgi:hypothetical protein